MSAALNTVCQDIRSVITRVLFITMCRVTIFTFSCLTVRHHAGSRAQPSPGDVNEPSRNFHSAGRLVESTYYRLDTTFTIYLLTINPIPAETKFRKYINIYHKILLCSTFNFNIAILPGKCSWLSQIQPKRNCPNLMTCV